MFGSLNESLESSVQEKDNQSQKSEENYEENYDLPLKERIIECIATNQSVVLKSQQRNEPDLTYDERKNITENILNNTPSQFLYRFGKYLKREHLQYFYSISDNTEMKFYLQETQKQLNDSTKKLRIRNRRYGAMRKMMGSSSCSYFTENEMRKREPLLYDELVDRNLTETERAERIRERSPSPINTFSDLLFEQIERNKVTRRKKEQERQEDDCFEEDDDDDEEETEYEEPRTPEEGEKELMREEFRSTLCAQFVSGRDKDFNYSEVDDCEDHDLLEWESQDLEDQYFDEEDPVTLPVDELMEDS